MEIKMNTSIKYMDYFIPSTKITVDEVLELNKDKLSGSGKSFNEFLKEFKEQSRLDKISVFNPDENLAVIVSGMIDKLFSTTGIKPTEIKYFVCGNPALMGGNVSVVHYIHKKFKLEKAVILPLFQPCASTIIAMGLSEKLLNTKTEEKEYILVISANRMNDIKSRYLGFTILGDGLSVALIENKPGNVNISDWNSFNYGASSYEKVENSDTVPDVFQLKSNIIRNGVVFLQRSLEKNDINTKDIDIIINPNTFYDVWHKTYSTLLNIEPNKFYLENIPDGGHINDVDLIRNTKDYIDRNMKDNNKMKVLIYAIDLVSSLDLNYHLISLDINNGC